MISQGSADMLPNLRGGAWDPHNHNTVATITDSSLHFWDLRSMKLVLDNLDHIRLSELILMFGFSNAVLTSMCMN